jgi:hypothetical protein
MIDAENIELKGLDHFLNTDDREVSVSQRYFSDENHEPTTT